MYLRRRENKIKFSSSNLEFFCPKFYKIYMRLEKDTSPYLVICHYMAYRI